MQPYKKAKEFTRANNGFTIVELLVVIVVIAILAGVVIVGYGQWRERSLGDAIKSDLKMAATANVGIASYSFETGNALLNAWQSHQSTGSMRITAIGTNGIESTPLVIPLTAVPELD